MRLKKFVIIGFLIKNFEKNKLYILRNVYYFNMDGYKLLFYLNIIIALIAVLIVGLTGIWIFFIWIILPLGIIAGFLKKNDENDVMFLIAGVVFVIVGEKFATSSLAITGIGLFLVHF